MAKPAKSNQKKREAVEESFLDERKSEVISNGSGSKRDGRGKRGLEDMMASMPNDAAQAVYAMERIAALEDGIHKVLTLCLPDALEIVYKQRPSLKKYGPQED